MVADFSLDGMSSATPLEALASGQTVNVADAFLGFGNGVIGSSILALCIGGIYLLAVRAITYEIPLATLVSFYAAEGYQQKAPSCQGRVHKVVSDTAEKAFYK